MERSHGTPAEAHHDNTSDKKDKKRSDRAAILRVPLVFEQAQQPERPIQKAKASPLEAALANLAAKKQESTTPEVEAVDQPAKSKEAESGTIDVEDSTSAARAEQTAVADEAASEPDKVAGEERQKYEQEAEEVYEPLRYQELESVDLSGGEVVIHLQGDEPISERVLPAEESTEALQPVAAEVPPPVFMPQPEQRHQAETPEAEQLPLAPPVVEAGEIVQPFEASVAPMEAAPRTTMPPVEMIQPQWEDTYGQQTPHTMAAPRGEQPATKRDVEDAAYRAEQAGQNRGLLTGLLVGGGYEHFKHKRRERRQEKRLRSQSKQLEVARQGYGAGLQEQSRRQAETTAQYDLVQRQVGGIEQRLNSQPASEKVRTSERLAPEPTEQLEIPPEHRLETSSWHSIEVDTRTGKPVENPAFQYGQEYHRERAQESALAAQQQANEATATATGPAAITTATTVPSRDEHANLPPVLIPSAATQGPPARNAARNDPSRNSAAGTDDTKPAPLWPWLLALFVVVVSLIVVLR